MSKCIQDGKKCEKYSTPLSQWPCYECNRIYRLVRTRNCTLKDHYKPEPEMIPVKIEAGSGDLKAGCVCITTELFDAMKKANPDGIEVKGG